MAKGGGNDERPIIVKKVIKKADGHHGGAWKVAYADFVTAMMAFFLLMWLLNVATDEQLYAISGHFDPTHPRVSERQSGAGGVLGGLSMAEKGAMATNVDPYVNRPPQPPGRRGAGEGRSEEGNLTDRSTDAIAGEGVGPGETEGEGEGAGSGPSAEEQAEQARFEDAMEEIKQAIQEDPELKRLSENIIVDITPDGLRIQIVDQEGESMFPIGSARMYEKTQKLIAKIADVVKKLPNEISLRGHTDGIPYGAGAEYTNWELSADRANASRRVLLEHGFPVDRINNVMGKADREHLLPDKPKDPRNRRITLVLLRDKIVNPPEDKPEAQKGKPKKTGDNKGPSRNRKPAKQEPAFERTEGNVYFP